MSITVTPLTATVITARLGFTPEESVVLACIPAPPATDGMIARIDLAALGPTTREGMLTRLEQPLRLAEPVAVQVLYFTEGDLRALTAIDAAVDDLLTRLGLPRCGTRLVDTPSPRGRAQLGAIAPAGRQARADAHKAILAGQPVTAVDYLHALDLVRTGAEVPPELLGQVAAWLRTKRHRDAVIALMVGLPRRDFVRATTRPLPEEDLLTPALEPLFSPAAAAPPGPDVATHVRLLTSVVACVPPRYQVSARTMLGLVAWWAGNGALADRHIGEARAIEPDYQLAVLLRDTLTAAVPPAWVRRR